MPLSKWAKHLRFSNNLLLITHSSYLKKRILAMRFFLLIPQFVGLLLSYTTLHHISKTISTLFRDFSETFPSQCRSHLVRMSFASRSHYGV